MEVLFYGLRWELECTSIHGQRSFAHEFPTHMFLGPRTLVREFRLNIMKFQSNLPMCRPSYIFFTSALILETSSLETEVSAKAFKSFSTASIRLTCAET